MNHQILTAQDVAVQIGVKAQRVRVLARSRNLGQQLSDGRWIFTQDDVEAMRVRKPGRPPWKQRKV